MSSAAKKKDPQKQESPLFQKNVIEAFCAGLKETLNTMAQVDITFENATIEMNGSKSDGDITGIVDFDTINFRGSMYVHFPADCLIKLYNAILGENRTEMHPDVMDCMGEISNMAYGVAKGKLDPLQLKFSMSLPRSIKTNDVQRLPNTPFLRIPFRLYTQRCLLDVTLAPK